MTISQERRVSIESFNAFNTGIMLSYQILSDTAYRPIPLVPGANTRRLTDRIIRFRTSGKCEQGSAILLSYLISQHGQKFDRFVLLNGKRDPSNKFKKNPNWNEHFYALARDTQTGLWLAASPANSDLGHITKPYVGSLIEVVNNISAQGGVWPAHQLIAELLATEYTEPRVERDKSDPDIVNVWAFTVGPAGLERGYIASFLDDGRFVLP